MAEERGHRVERLYAFLAEHGDGCEGIVGVMNAGAWVPLVGGDMDRMVSLWPLAEAVARETGLTLRLVEFSQRQEVDTIAPGLRETAGTPQ